MKYNKDIFYAVLFAHIAINNSNYKLKNGEGITG